MTTPNPEPLRIDDEAVVWSADPNSLEGGLIDRPLVLVMHGRGSHEGDLPRLFPGLPAGAVYASLRAPLSAAPWGMGGWTWFPLDTPGGPTGGEADAAATAVLEWLDRLAHRHGTPAAVAAMGFSQGGAMSLQLLRLEPQRFAAAVNLSGFSAPGTARADAELRAHPRPAFWGRDVADPIMSAEKVEATAKFLPAHFTVTAREYPGIEHSISPAELADVSAFLSEVLALPDAA